MDSTTLKQRLELYRLFSRWPFGRLLQEVDELLLCKISGVESPVTFWRSDNHEEQALRVIRFYLSSSDSEKAEFREAFDLVLKVWESDKQLGRPHGDESQVASAKNLRPVVVDNSLRVTLPLASPVVQTGLPLRQDSQK